MPPQMPGGPPMGGMPPMPPMGMGPQPGMPGPGQPPQGMPAAQMAQQQAAGANLGDDSSTAGQLAKLALAMIQHPIAAQGFAMRQILDSLPRMFKAQNSVAAMAPKMTATTPFAPPVGRADQAALGQMQGGGPPGAMPPGGAPNQPGAGMPPQAAMLAQLAAMRGGM